MMGFDGTTVNDQIKTLITSYHVGSILLTAKNLECDVLLPSFVSFAGMAILTLLQLHLRPHS